VRVAGIDPGTGSMDIVVVDDEGPRLVAEYSVERARVTSDPSIVTRLIERLAREHSLEAIAAPSGYGLHPDSRDPRAICEARS